MSHFATSSYQARLCEIETCNRQGSVLCYASPARSAFVFPHRIIPKSLSSMTWQSLITWIIDWMLITSSKVVAICDHLVRFDPYPFPLSYSLSYCSFSFKRLIISTPNACSILHIVSKDIFSCPFNTLEMHSLFSRQASVVSVQVPTYVLTWRKQSPASILPSLLYPVPYWSFLPSEWKQQRVFCLPLYSLKNTLFCGCKWKYPRTTTEGCVFKLSPF